MPDFNVRSDSVNVEQIMEQIRARIREKRGVDYTEQQIRELAAVKLDRFLDPSGVRSDLLEQFRKVQPPYSPPELPNYAFEEATLYESHRGPLRLIRKLLHPILKLFFNPNPLIQALNIQSRLNTMSAEREAKREAARRASDQLFYELIHNLVIETTRMSIEVKNLKMRIESIGSRLEFNERRARALEAAVVYKSEDGQQTESRQSDDRRDSRQSQGPSRPQAQGQSRPPSQSQPREQSRPQPQGPSQMPSPGPSQMQPQSEAQAETQSPPQPQSQSAQGGQPGGAGEGPGQRSRRRRRRRGRRGRGPASAIMGAPPPGGEAAAGQAQSADAAAHDDFEGAGGDDSPSDQSPAHEPSSHEPPSSDAPSTDEPSEG